MAGPLVNKNKLCKQTKTNNDANFVDFELSAEGMSSIETLDQKTSIFFDHSYPAVVNWLGTNKVNI